MPMITTQPLSRFLAGVFPACLVSPLLLLHTACRPLPSTPSPQDSVLRVTATIQYPDLHRPWLKKPPSNRQGLATVIEGGRLLVTADMVDQATFIQLEKPEDGPKVTAQVEAIDPECNLAVLRPESGEIMKGTHPLPLDLSLKAGSKLEILQLEPNGAPALSPATVTTVAVMPYPADGAAYLLYRAATSIPQREGSYVIPALAGEKLAGLVMRYDPRSQSADIIPAPLIARFLKESAKPDYHGLARAGITWEEVHGGNLREWLGLGKGSQGVYITSVDREGPAAKAGLKKGDILIKVAGKEIDGEGNYSDPRLGKITFNNLASLERGVGDPVELTYFRSSGEGTGTLGTATLTLAGRNPLSEISPARLGHDTTAHAFLGGLLFQELSRPYLREWGPEWRRQAPQNLVYLDAFQRESEGKRDRFVILSAILPTPQTIGYQDLAKRQVLSINGMAVKSLKDVTEAAKHPVDGFHKILLEGAGGPIFLDASNLPAEESLVRERYGIPSANPASKD